MVNTNNLFLKILHKLPAELSHNIVIKILKYGLFSKNKIIFKNCSTKLGSISFLHPVGIAAGFDKNAETINYIHKTGASHIEIGTVTPNEQQGNPKPRIFRLIKNRAVINSMGFPSKGMKYVIKQLKNNRSDLPIGINIGCNKNTKDHVKDYTLLTKNLGIYADWITINISSPNTPGLRNLQTSSELLKLLSNVDNERKNIEDLRGNKLQVWLKISPDLNDFELKNLIDKAIKNNIDALSISNTTISRPKNLIYSKNMQQGGVSGKPLFNISTQILAKSYLHANREIKFVGIGGIDNAENAFTKILAGASVIQSYTGLSYNGPRLITDIVKYIDTKIKYSSIDDFVGIKAEEIARNKLSND